MTSEDEEFPLLSEELKRVILFAQRSAHDKRKRFLHLELIIPTAQYVERGGSIPTVIPLRSPPCNTREVDKVIRSARVFAWEDGSDEISVEHFLVACRDLKLIDAPSRHLA